MREYHASSNPYTAELYDYFDEAASYLDESPPGLAIFKLPRRLQTKFYRPSLIETLWGLEGAKFWDLYKDIMDKHCMVSEK